MVRSFVVASLLAALVLVPSGPVRADEDLEVGGRHFARSITVEYEGDAHELRATGSHKRKKFFFSVYAAVAYADAEAFWAQPASDEDAGARILDSGGPLHMHLKMLRGLDATRISNGINEALDKTATRPVETIATERARFVGLFDGELQEDQSLQMTWWPGLGLEIRIDDETIDTIPGDAFARAFFEIYFGPEPVDGGMKRDLLREVEDD